MKPGLNFEFVRHADRSFEDAARKARDLGYRYVEPCLIQGHCTLSEAGYCHWQSMDSRDPRRMKDFLDNLGLAVSGVSAHAQLLQGWSVEHLHKALRFAALLGAPIVNTAEGKRPAWLNPTDAFTLLEIHLRAVLQVAEEVGIYVGFEPHGEFSTRPEQVLELLERIDSPWLAINFDPGNAFLAGQGPAAYLRQTVRYVRHVHAKDISRDQAGVRGTVTGTPVGTAVGEGEIGFDRILEILHQNQYTGVLSVECATEEQAAQSLAYLNRAIARLESNRGEPTHVP